MLECNMLKRALSYKPDSSRRNHRYSAIILVEDIIGSRPGRTGRMRPSICRPAERKRRSETSSASSCHVSVSPRTSSPASCQHCLITSTLLASKWTLNVAHEADESVDKHVDAKSVVQDGAWL